VGGKVYAVGGQHCYADCLVTQMDVHAWDPATDTWTAVASLPVGLGHITGATLAWNGKIVVIGGETAHRSANSVANVRLYDPATNRWTEMTPLPKPTHSGVAGVINQQFYYSTGTPPNYDVTTYQGIVST
jgi:N-acetylneuraminic acid mutarotase